MPTDADRMNDSDIRQIARMHADCLPDSLVTKLGPAYTESFYRYVDRSPSELAFLHHDGSEVMSACIVSLEPHTLQRRLLFHTPLLLRAPLAARRLPLRALAGGLAKRGRDESSEQPRGPEVLLIFTQPRARGTGIGTETLARSERYLGELGHPRYFVKTLDSSGNRAIAFYQRNGFSQIGSIAKHGKKLGLWEKAL